MTVGSITTVRGCGGGAALRQISVATRGVAMGWAGFSGPRGAGAPEFHAKQFNNKFPVTVKIGTSGYRTRERVSCARGRNF